MNNTSKIYLNINDHFLNKTKFYKIIERYCLEQFDSEKEGRISLTFEEHTC